MAHIPEGVVSAPVLIGAGVVAVAALCYAVRKLDYAKIPHAAVLAACFFVASLIAVPAGPSSVHLLLNGLMGLLLGWTAVPAIMVALALQAVFFGFGGPLVLGVNALNIALPALIVAGLFSGLLSKAIIQRQTRRIYLLGGLAGLIGVVGTGAMVCFTLIVSYNAYRTAANIIALTYLPLAIVEALVTATIVGFIAKVAPEMLTKVVYNAATAENSELSAAKEPQNAEVL
ncbi:cobalt transporter CbiM [Shewanella avicenniae]|uniref:Cobalt transporter CbiM n=1 Tax=Shewanella avicenniae TaxID=2814294 RepID=A0ABX7QU14_9GAMM|nr:cobalt transporter CbiM [Shewanella avicenniae]QSX34982.1 cobalt transporter CbiM [Shewanella avicenniae]